MGFNEKKQKEDLDGVPCSRMMMICAPPIYKMSFTNSMAVMCKEIYKNIVDGMRDR